MEEKWGWRWGGVCAGEVKGVRGRWEVLGEMQEVWGGREEYGGEEERLCLF